MIRGIMERTPAELEREAQQVRREGMSESYVFARQFFVMMRSASRAALVRKGVADMQKNMVGNDRFVLLEGERTGVWLALP